MIKRICKYCNKEYDTYPSVKLYFCSHRCSSDWKKGKSWKELYKNAEYMFKMARSKRNSKSTEFKAGWQNTKKGLAMIKKSRKTMGSKGSPKTEEIMKKIIKDNNLPFNFVGDGELMVGTKNPDFVYSSDGRKIIEVFGDYWHRDDIAKYWHQTEDGCKAYYEAFGYNILIIWERELKNPDKVLNRVRDFIATSLEMDAPSDTKKLFMDIANTNYNGDIGMTLKSILDGYMMFKIYFENMDMKLDKILCELNENTKEIEESSDSEIKMMNGRIVEKGGMCK